MLLLSTKTVSVFVLSVFIPILVHSQSASNNNTSFVSRSLNNPIEKKNYISIELSPAIIPPATITRDRGKYKLKSRLQSSYDLGINYLHNINKNLFISTGLHFVIGKRNLFVNIPSEDINNADGRNYIEDKELWSCFRIPVIVEKKLYSKKALLLSIRGGVNLRYSGFMSDESFGVTYLDANNQNTQVFEASYSARNNGKPWITFLCGIYKSIPLNNENILAIGLQADISTKYFFKGDYQITLPNQPITSGKYKINGSSLGLSVQYIFTGSNKRIVKEYEKKGF